MHELKVQLEDKSYKIQIGNGLLDSAGEIIQTVYSGEHVVVITDEIVRSLYGYRLEASLKDAGLSFDIIEIPVGEANKSLNGFANVCEKFASLGILREHLVIAFGGGVVGDLAGFVAAVYMRGIAYVQIPTTLLAQVDSSVGGKTAIDLSHGKNLVGAFHQPLMVITDPALFVSLNKKQLSEGMAEIIKYGAIRDNNLFEKLVKCEGFQGIFNNIEDIIFRCCDIKKSLVETDEKDNGVRMKLNFGHSFGHAIEKLGNYESYTHGQGVAAGMVLAAKAGEALGLTQKGTVKRLESILKLYELPDKIDMDISLLIRFMSLDKKNQGKKLRLVLLQEIGKSFIYTLTPDELISLLRKGK